MKWLLFYFPLLLCFMTAKGQVPQAVNYQGVVRDLSGNPVPNKNVRLRLSVTAQNQSVYYAEVQDVQTNALGLFAVKIGQGNPVNGSFANIPWSSGEKLLKVEIDVNGGSNFQLLGQPETLVSVPYALQAASASEVTLAGDISGKSNATVISAIQGKPVSALSPGVGEVLKWNGAEWQPDVDATSGGGSYTAGQGISIGGNVISNTGDLSNTNEIQQLSLSGANLSLSNGGGSVTLPAVPASYWENAGGNDIINNNTGTVFVGNQNVPYQAIFASTNNNSGTIVAQNNGTGKAIEAMAADGTAVKAQSTGGLGLDVTSNNRAAVFKGYVSSQSGVGVVDIENTNRGALGLSVTGGLNIDGGQSISNFVGTISFDLLEGFRFCGFGLLPYVDRGGSIGSSSLRWSTIYAANGTINTSDARQKQAITPITYGLKQVMAMKPVSFEWKANPEQGRKLGFLAQDLQSVVPEVVSDKEWISDEKGKMTSRPAAALGVYYSDLIPVMTKAIQEQQTLIENLQKQNDSLLKRIEALEQGKKN